MKNLKKIVNSDAAYEILDSSNCAGSTWTEGGCAILAQALNMLEGYPIYVIYNKRIGSSEHFGVMTPSGAILDADGEHRNTDAWLNFFKENEMPRAGELVVIPFNSEVDMEGIHFDDEAARELAGLIGKQSMIRETVRSILKESNEKVWYHGTPDVREIEKEGGFTQKFLNIDYVDDLEGWENYQKELASRRESGDEDGYFKLLGSHDFRKSAKIRKPIFLSDVYSVAKTYTTRMAFDYQNSIEKVLKVKVKSNNGVVINAPGHRFRFIDIEPVKRGFIAAGVNGEELDLIIKKLNYAQGVGKGIRTDDIAAIGDWFGFDYIDVVGVLDSYEGGNTKSTVRMVFNPSDIEIIKESNNLREFEEYIDSVFNVLKESDEPSPTFEWDIAKEKIDNSKKNIKTREQAYDFLVRLLDKIKNLPKAIKLRITKYTVMSFMMLLGAGVINGIVSDKTPEISHEIAAVIDNISSGSEVKQDIEPIRSSSISLVKILKHEEGSITNKGEPVLKAYKLGDGMITVGWGHAERTINSQFKPGQEITRQQAEKLLSADIAESERGLNIILDDWKEQGIELKITQPMYDAMVSMIFNMGIGNFRKSDFIQLVKNGDYEMAAERILTTNVSYPGHVPRREKESKLFSKGLESNDMSEIRKMIRNVLKEEVGGEKFNAWFDGSKVVDSSGNPLVVHHGTSEKFSKFNLNKTTQGIIWFTSNKNSVEAGEVGAQGRGHIMDLYVRMKNPAGWDEYDKYSLYELQSMGYDGAILPDSDGSITGFVFNPGQLKSATNKGEWSSGNDNIFKEDLSEIRDIVRSTIKEEVIEETQTGQRDLEKLTNDILKSLSREILKSKAHMIFLTDNEDEPITSFPIVNTVMYNGDGFEELSDFIEETNIRIVPTRLIRGKKSIKGELEYSPGDRFGNEFYKIWLKYDNENLDGINELFRVQGKDITENDVYFNIFYLWYSTLLHELQHAYDAWRSKGKAFGGQLTKSYTALQDKANNLMRTKSGYDDMTPEEIDAINDSRKAYLNLVHEINARYAQAMQKTILTGMDYDTFDDIKKNWNDVIGSFRVNFAGWRHLSDKMKKKLTRRVAKAYQEAIENLKTASEKYSKEDLEMVSENLQLADKTYFTPGKLSPRVRQIIVDKITGGDAWTKLITDIYYATLQDSHAVGDWAVRSIDDSNAEIDRTEKKIEDDVLSLEEWKKIKSYYQQLKSYNKNVFPIDGLNPNGVEDIWNVIQALKQRAIILEKIKELPSVALRNMREDIRTPRTGNQMNRYRDDLETFLAHYSLLSNRDEKLRSVVLKKMFKSGVTLDELLDFVDEKENLLGGAKFDNEMIKKIINENDELEIIYEKGDIMVIEVGGPYGIKEIGCNSVWCFTYGEGWSRNWSEYSYNDTVYVVIDFGQSPEDADFMHVVIKPINYNPTEEEENDEKIFDMANRDIANTLGFLDYSMGIDNAKKLLTFYEEPEEEEDEEEKEYVDPNQMSLFEVRKLINGFIKEAIEPDYKKWKRNNVTLRGMSDVGRENSAGARFGSGLYTAFLGNRAMAKEYGKVYFAVGAIPKNPVVVNDANQAEIWIQYNLYKYEDEKLPNPRRFYDEGNTIEGEMLKRGYDGLVIKGREMVNYAPGDDVMYFDNENHLIDYYEYNVKNKE